MPEAATIRVTVVYLPAPRALHEWSVWLGEGACVSQALQASGLSAAFPELDLSTTAIGIWGCQVAHDRVLQDLDRVEIYRPLLVDPKVARRERFNRQGSRAAGLFSKKGPGAKPAF